ncbi:DNA mismatch repair endonuclease MutL [Planktothrix sp. FACHB-1355]|uniref:DNA mismatch repair protein MutL n=1 Tax=Aerosakkonema funiforme FACHB-1375 TaxID=2949571 RepID=A0A926ZIZ4_9CYAN|nr:MULTISPECIES: DNA mismatch repair endonuclease MutL [Oscillatoriales]MBD2184595.1 DNA mismatch repair endonuclease MutL [Aerosakkonema funiforme FACHB-1375]MBD3558490.1 DNA mismatch repair endonuclease MutL [Planktothrix sp. FACHB-1355]
MPSPIQFLPAEVVHLIAAGEVIDSLAAVVRELVENALDANATRITISLWPEQWRVRVADNGCGMDLDDLRLAATAHSTSKIRRCEDLWKITSLGFRGEALHSLAQLSELEICSRTADGTQGWRILYDGLGEPAIEQAIAIASGTIVTAANIFGTWTVRRQGLPPAAQQLKAVQATIHQIALCHPQVTWQVQQNDRQWFTISPGDTPQQILPQILRDIHLSDLQQLKLELETLKDEGGNLDVNSPLPLSTQSLELVLGLPDRCHRRRPDWVRVATNGRMVKSPELEQTILASFQRTLPRDRYPICFLHLQISPDRIDWNRHPAKAEIYLHSINYWQQQVTQAIDRALQISVANLPEAAHSERVGKLLTAAENKSNYNVNRSISPVSSPKDDIGLMELRAVSQIHNTYIVAEHPAGVWLVEQHIAHERVIYEQICSAWQLVPVQPPIVLTNLSPAQVEQLQRIGLEIETFGEQMWAVRTVPELLAKREDCANALLELSLGGDLQTAQVAVACRTAIRNGTPLTLPQMQTLLEQWQYTRHPRTCPHGRPIYLALEESALARFFRRHWVIGKSHGI